MYILGKHVKGPAKWSDTFESAIKWKLNKMYLKVLYFWEDYILPFCDIMFWKCQKLNGDHRYRHSVGADFGNFPSSILQTMSRGIAAISRVMEVLRSCKLLGRCWNTCNFKWANKNHGAIDLENGGITYHPVKTPDNLVISFEELLVIVEMCALMLCSTAIRI